MKKIVRRKLVVDKETLRTLSVAQMQQVDGGAGVRKSNDPAVGYC